MSTTTISFPSLAELNACNFTLDQVDNQLRFLASILKYGHKSNRKNCTRKIDYYLDVRLELTK